MNYLNIKKYSALLSTFTCVLAMVSREKDYEPADFTSDAAWYTTETGKHTDAYRMNLGSTVSFMDASQGCKSHQWILEPGSKFMVDDFDVANKDYVNQIDPSKGSVSTNTVESVYFSEVGPTKVTLRNTFYDWVTSHDKQPVEAKLIGNEWVLVREFKIDVYDKLKPAFRVLVDGQEKCVVAEDELVNGADKSAWTTINLTLGQKLTFEVYAQKWRL